MSELDDRIESILASWRLSLEDGCAPDPEDVIAAHPDIGAELRNRFRVLAALHRVLPRTAPPGPPSRLGRYKIVRELGRGGMGAVYEAIADQGTDAVRERVALKVIHPHLLEQPGFRRRFLKEAQLGGAVRHENVVRTITVDAVEEEGRWHHFLVMEYVEGQSLRGLLAELDYVPEELCRRIVESVARGLDAIHAQGAVHRDLKPENVLITPDHVVKVMDLGVARLADEAARLSQSGAFVGSIHYAAPEQFGDSSTDVDPRADLHALGLLLYELASGRHPYYDSDVRVAIARVLRSEPKRLGEVSPHVTPFLEELAHVLLAKDPEDRPDTALVIADILRDGESSDWWRRSSRALRDRTRRPLRRVRVPRETAVYGRDTELATLRELLRHANAGDGVVALIEGEAGVGKSRLLDEFVGEVLDGDIAADVLFARFAPGGVGGEFGAFAEAFRDRLGEAGSSRHMRDTPRLSAAFDAFLAGELPAENEKPLERDALQTAFVRCLQALATDRAVVLVVEDLHFASKEGRALFSAIAHAVPAHRVLLLGTYRPGLPTTWVTEVTRRESDCSLTLDRLGPKDLAALLAESFASQSLADQLGGQIGRKSDGNPFFVFEIIRGLRESGGIERMDDGSWVRTQALDDVRMPESVLDLINARIAALPEVDRELLDIAAVCGFAFDASLVALAMDTSRIACLRRLAWIERTHRLVRAVGHQFVFDHHQIHEALYARMSEPLRKELHAALASALSARVTDVDEASVDDTVDLSRHMLAADHSLGCGPVVRRALEHLHDAFRNDEFAQLARRAIDADGVLTSREKAETLLLLAEGALDRAAQTELSEATCREALDIARSIGDRTLETNALLALSKYVYRQYRFDESESLAQEARALARELGNPHCEQAAIAMLANALRDRGRPQESLVLYEEQRSISERHGLRIGEMAAIGNSAQALSHLGDLRGALDGHLRAYAIAEDLGLERSMAKAHSNIGSLYDDLGSPTDARSHLDRALELCRTTGDRRQLAHTHGLLGSVAWSSGRIEDAESHYELYLITSREVGDRLSEAIAHSNLGDVDHQRGDRARAEMRQRDCLRIARESGAERLVTHAQFAIGSVVESQVERREWFTSAFDRASEAGLLDVMTMALCELAQLPGGSPEEAVEAVAANARALPRETLRQAHFALWKSTGDEAHLRKAKQLLDDALSALPVGERAAMVANLRQNQELVDAWNARDDRIAD